MFEIVAVFTLYRSLEKDEYMHLNEFAFEIS